MASAGWVVCQWKKLYMYMHLNNYLVILKSHIIMHLGCKTTMDNTTVYYHIVGDVQIGFSTNSVKTVEQGTLYEVCRNFIDFSGFGSKPFT